MHTSTHYSYSVECKHTLALETCLCTCWSQTTRKSIQKHEFMRTITTSTQPQTSACECMCVRFMTVLFTKHWKKTYALKTDVFFIQLSSECEPVSGENGAKSSSRLCVHTTSTFVVVLVVGATTNSLSSHSVLMNNLAYTFALLKSETRLKYIEQSRKTRDEIKKNRNAKMAATTAATQLRKLFCMHDDINRVVEQLCDYGFQLKYYHSYDQFW